MRARSLVLDRRWVTAIAVVAAAVAALLDVTLLWPQWSRAGHLRTGEYLTATTATFVLAPATAGALASRPLIRSSLLGVGVAASTAVAIRVVPYRSAPTLCVALALSAALEAAPGWRSTLRGRTAVLMGGAVGFLPLLLV